MGTGHEMHGAGQFGGGRVFMGHPGFGTGSGFRQPSARTPINVEFRGPANDDGGRQHGHWPPPGGAPDDGDHDRFGGWGFHGGRPPQGGDDGRPGHDGDPDCPPKHGEDHHHGGGGFWGAVGRFFGVHRNYDYPVDYTIPSVTTYVVGSPQNYYAGQTPGAAAAPPPPPPPQTTTVVAAPPPPPPTPVTVDASQFAKAEFATGKHELTGDALQQFNDQQTAQWKKQFKAMGVDVDTPEGKARLATMDITMAVAGSVDRQTYHGEQADGPKNRQLGSDRGSFVADRDRAILVALGVNANNIHITSNTAAQTVIPPATDPDGKAHPTDSQADRVGSIQSIKVLDPNAPAATAAATTVNTANNTTVNTVTQPPVDTSGFVALSRGGVQQVMSVTQDIKAGLRNGDFANNQITLPSAMLFAQGEDRTKVSADTLAAREKAIITAMNTDSRNGRVGQLFSDANDPNHPRNGATVAFADTLPAQGNGNADLNVRFQANSLLTWQKPDAAGTTVGLNGAAGGPIGSLRTASAGDLAAAAPPPPPGDAPLNGASVAAAIETGMRAGASSQPPPAAKSAAASRLFMMDRG